MSFVHDDPEFDELLQIVANSRGIGVALVETFVRHFEGTPRAS